MAGVAGMVIDVKSLMSTEMTEVKYSKGKEKDIPLIVLKQGRSYSVPFYQREIRWNKRNILTLINDIYNDKKFLGNIILTEDANGDYEILDGQQRLTSILLLYSYIRYKYETRLQVFDICDFEIKSFSGFTTLLEHNFNMSEIEDEIGKIQESDDYQQMKNYFNLWNTICQCERLNKIADAQKVLKNLSECEVNIIINKDNRENSISRFLDVNLKGVKLDTEDIFKSYLYAQDSSDEIHRIWSEIKKKDAIYREKKNATYPLMTLIEHYFKCAVIEDDRYEHIDFNSEFELCGDTEVEGTLYIQGTHILTVFKDIEYIKKCMKDISRLYDYFIDIVGSEGVGSLLKEHFTKFNASERKKDKRLDDNEMKIIHNLTKKILLDKDKVPKCLLIKYLLETLLCVKPNKSSYLNIYALSTFSLIFSLFQYKKDLSVISDIITSKEWVKDICKYVREKLAEYNLSHRQIILVYRFGSGIDEEERGAQQYRCKTLAMIYNFIDITEGSISVKNGKKNQLLDFVNNDNKFSVEHFIINESGKCVVQYGEDRKKSCEYEYPDKIKKMKDSLFNYIFISQKNNSDIENVDFTQKVHKIKKELKKQFASEECSYSKLVIDAINTYFYFPDLAVETEEQVTDILDKYFNEKFIEEYANFSKYIIKKAI